MKQQQRCKKSKFLRSNQLLVETKASSPQGQCIPAGSSVSPPRLVLLSMSIITMLFPANSASDCLRFAKSRPQFSNLVAPTNNGYAKCLVRYKGHLVP